jgi:hypothetical protein
MPAARRGMTDRDKYRQAAEASTVNWLEKPGK